MPDDRAVRRLFDEVVALALEERRQRLEQARLADADAAAQVEDLLRCHDERTGLKGEASVKVPELLPANSLLAGKYRIAELIGEGAFGAVYRAQQEEPVRRTVAIKVLKVGLDTHAVVRRFELERQVLAAMDHPGIATVLDAGTTDLGRPFFAMEFVDGEPLTRSCDARNLDLPERLSVFCQVCDAVHHAHQRGVIHRDLKPSNVLVSESQNGPRARIIDFGIAQTVDRAPTDRRLTLPTHVMGTPPYMSPEQRDPTVLDIDVRSDVYSLGVILFELLTGPIEDPHTPWQGTTPTPSSVSRARPRPTPVPIEMIRGDLDWIAERAAAFDRDDRYPSVSELGADVRRFLRHEPLSIGPRRWTYHARKFWRRHALVSTMVLLLGSSIVGGSAVSAWLAVRATAAERDGRRDAERARHTLAILVDAVRSVHPSEAGGPEVPVREVLDRIVADVMASDLTDDPLLEAEIRATIGYAYLGIERFQHAEPHLVRALDLYNREHGPDHPDSIEAVNRLASLRQDQRSVTAADALYRRAIEAATKRLGASDRRTLRYRNNLADLRRQTNRADEAYDIQSRVVEEARAAYGAGDPDTLSWIHNLGRICWEQQRHDEAERCLREAWLGEKAILDPQHPSVIINTTSLGAVLTALGKTDESQELCRSALHNARAAFGNDHSVTATCAWNTGSSLRRTDPAAAVAYFEEANRFFTNRANLPEASRTSNVIASVHRDLGNIDTAETFYSRAVAGYAELEDPFMLGVVRKNYGRLLMRCERFGQCERELLAAHALLTLDDITDPRAGAQRDAVRRLLHELYTETEQPVEASRWVTDADQ